MAQQRKALGRGISSLIRKQETSVQQGDHPHNASTAANRTNTAVEKPSGFVEINIAEIQVNPRQPRKHFQAQALEELKQSIVQSGVLQPILVREIPNGYELIAGERRLRASQLAGLASIPALIKNMNDQTQLEVAIVENLQRQDLTVIEEAKGYERLSKEFLLNQEQIAQKVGKDRSTVSNLMRLLKLTPMVQAYVNEGKLNMGHARALIAFDPQQQEHYAEKIIAQDLSVRAVEQLVKQNNQNQSTQLSKKPLPSNLNPNLKHVQNLMQQRLGTKVEIKPKGKGGSIQIDYYGHQDLERISKVLS